MPDQHRAREVISDVSRQHLILGVSRQQTAERFKRTQTMARFIAVLTERLLMMAGLANSNKH